MNLNELYNKYGGLDLVAQYSKILLTGPLVFIYHWATVIIIKNAPSQPVQTKPLPTQSVPTEPVLTQPVTIWLSWPWLRWSRTIRNVLY